jgi:hypothetical protein
MRLHPLVACVALAFSTGTPGAGSDASAQSPLSAVGGRHATHFARPALNVASAVNRFVKTCDDPLPLPSTCEESVDNTVHTVQTVRQGLLCGNNDDAVDLTQLTCSKITLSAPLVAGPGSIALYGPGQDKLTIDATGKFRALVHNAGEYYGLYVSDLTIANGRYDSPLTFATGGCISSNGNVFVSDSAVSSCYVSSSVYAQGGDFCLRNGQPLPQQRDRQHGPWQRWRQCEWGRHRGELSRTQYEHGQRQHGLLHGHRPRRRRRRQCVFRPCRLLDDLRKRSGDRKGGH